MEFNEYVKCRSHDSCQQTEVKASSPSRGPKQTGRELPSSQAAGSGSGSGRSSSADSLWVSSQPVTSRKELWGWYLYEASSSGFSGSVLPVFLPLLVLTLTTDRAWNELGGNAPPACDSTHKLDCLKCVPGKGDRLLTVSGYEDLPRLRVHLGGLAINPVSFTTVAIGLSIIFQLLIFGSYGPFTDYGRWRKVIWIVGSALGALGCIACVGLDKPSLWWLSGVILIATNVCYGLAYICYNSYLPALTDSSPEVRESVASNRPLQEQLAIRMKVENQISLTAINVGSLLTVVVILISFSVALIPGLGDNLILRLTCLIGGLWWAILFIPSVLLVKSRPGPPLPKEAGFFFGWIKIWELLKASTLYKYAFRYLLIYFVYSDGYTTLNQTGALFAQQQLCMTTPELVGLVVLVAFFAIVGNPIFGFVQNKMKWDNNTMVIIGLLLMSTLPAYGILGFFTPDGSWGLKTPLEMFIFAGWYGISYGALSSYSRTLFADLIPVQQEAAMFTLFALSSKGSSWLGPLLVAFLAQVFGDLRTVFVYLLIVILVPVVLLHLFIDNAQGTMDAGRVCQPESLEEDDCLL